MTVSTVLTSVHEALLKELSSTQLDHHASTMTKEEVQSRKEGITLRGRGSEEATINGSPIFNYVGAFKGSQELKGPLGTRRGKFKVSRHLKEAVANYKVYVGFGKGLERSKVASYKFGYLIALAHFKGRYLELELEENLFINYPEDKNIHTESKVPFDDNPNSPPRSDA
ncbi:hypothetical protein GW17_00048896 [Ensete ventricosum]|nr:hypothetical protein GW17_00048896 [Ensete ventricosum]